MLLYDTVTVGNALMRLSRSVTSYSAEDELQCLQIKVT